MSYYGNSYNKGSGSFSLIAVIVVIIVCVLWSCSTQNTVKNWGGKMDLNLEPNQKLVNITWKDSDLWILTKEMTEEDAAENYQFTESSNMGIFEGTIYIHETKLSQEEYKEYLLQLQLREDYNKSGNLEYTYDGKTIERFISYDSETDTFKIMKEYQVIDDEIVEK